MKKDWHRLETKRWKKLYSSKAVKVGAKVEANTTKEVEVEAIHTVVLGVGHTLIRLPLDQGPGPTQDQGHIQDQDHILIIRQDLELDQDLLRYKEEEVPQAFWIREE